MRRWYKSLKNAERDAEKENCEIVASNNRWTDIFYLVPRDAERGKIYRTIARSQADVGPERSRVIYVCMDGKIEVIDDATNYRINIVRRGLLPEDKVVSYLHGYYTRMEERSEKIRRRKERARISHEMCCVEGKEGHELRQAIRRELAYKGI